MRQGCPLSPYLFLLIVDELSRIIKEAAGNHEFKGVLIGKALCISHFLFVDGVLLFFYGDERELKKYLDIIDLFCASTRMEINYGKSSCFYHNIHRSLIVGMYIFYPLEKMELGTGFRYLDYFFKPNNYSKQDCFWLIGKVERKIHH